MFFSHLVLYVSLLPSVNINTARLLGPQQRKCSRAGGEDTVLINAGACFISVPGETASAGKEDEEEASS